MVAYVCRGIWFTSEWSGIGLGRFAPWVFGGMVGAFPVRIHETRRESAANPVGSAGDVTNQKGEGQ